MALIAKTSASTGSEFNNSFTFAASSLKLAKIACLTATPPAPTATTNETLNAATHLRSRLTSWRRFLSLNVKHPLI